MSKTTTSVQTLNCDVLIIGAGIAGCAAAQAAAEQGASVLVLEQAADITAHGMDVGAIGSALQQTSGVSVDPLEAARLLYQWSQSKANYRLLRVFTDRSGEVMDRYIQLAEQSGLEVRLNDTMTARVDWDQLDERFRQFRTAHTFSPKGKPVTVENKSAVRHFVSMLAEDARANGARFLFRTRGLRLHQTRGRITGCLAVGPEGRLRIRARRGVILATGGISENEELMKQYCPEALRADKNEYFPHGGNLGDGLMLAQRLGAALTRSGAAPVIHPVNFTPLGPGIQTSWLMVNRDGLRFCCEMGFEPIVTNARLNAPGNVAWAIWDSRYPEMIQKQEPHKAGYLLPGLEEKVEQAVQNGDYLRADSLAGLAAAMGVPAEALEETAARYNSHCHAGLDPDFGVPERFLCPVEQGPFYASRVSAWLLNVPFGLHVDHNSQVLTEDDQPIRGLFAIGNMQGDFFGNSYPVTCPGANHGRSVTFGRLVGLSLAEGRTIDGSPA